jgi:hypothetical protein
VKGFLGLAVLKVLVLAIVSAGFPESVSVRPSALSGSWYPADRETLEKQIDAFLEKVPQSAVGQEIVGMISPHAGYDYSGGVAAWGYKYLQARPCRRVLVLAPSHCVSFTGVSIPGVDYYETPLGRVKVDRQSCEDLLKKPLFRNVHQAHLREHAVEIQLPFLQRTVKNFALIPLVVGSLKEEHYENVSNVLKGLMNPGTLFIASSDFTHFGPRFRYVPFTTDLRENISRLDHGAIDLILQKDAEGFLAYKKTTRATICGFRSIALLLKILPSDYSGKLLQYRLSGDLTGDYTSSVSYASIIFIRDRD